ncbi:hypothetical protein [Pectinatus frisingensis]|uniref:hypothetical protein n=1 Tax=Pectinatus frisingensis TaxID=865 RepID=UPI0018C7B28E|nr:hypothetical protein [Pectinatus frisingensis]
MKRHIRNQILNIMVSVKKGLAYFQVSDKYIVLKKCIQALQSVEQLCQNGFSKTRADYYNQDFSVIIDKLSRQLTTQQNIDKFDCDAFIKSLDIISARLSNDKEVKKEIIFLPYKASMWDSLESIWQAAADDKENCDAYVIPIPYCDRNPDGSAAQWHCEADQFPSYVPITDYREYDIAKHRPDVIYIHNPYDGYNRVTSVDSNYYSSELKKYTNMLVYVPYFVSGPAVSEGICQAPGIVVADHVIVESEEIKKQYEAYYPGGNPPKDKFLALGSPKFDKVLSSKKEDFVLPDNWGKIINGRKIILYNTSLGAMLENSDKVSAKLRYVFSVFKERKDVALWWRPHPLMKATMESMRPEILQEYEQIEQAYINEGWGIYDDTAELDRAITWSDAYYGDMSSVVWLYKVTGKPVMVEDMINIKRQPLKILNSVGFLDADVNENVIWGIPYLFSCLCSVDFVKQIILCEKLLPIEKTNKPYSYLITKKIDNKIFIPPFYGDDLLIYDIEHDYFDTVYLKKIDEIKKNAKFLDIYRWGDFVFFIGCGYPAIIRYDLNTMECVYYTEWYNAIRKYIIDKNNALFFHVCKCREKADSLLITFAQSNILMEFNLKTGNSILHFIGKVKCGLYNIYYDGDNYWITGYATAVIKKWNYLTNKCIEYNDFPEKFKLNKEKLIIFSNIFSYDNKIYFLPYCANMIIQIDRYSGRMTGIFTKSRYMSVNVMNNGIIATSLYENYKVFEYITFKYGVIKINRKIITLSNRLMYVKEFFDSNQIVDENKMNLEEFLVYDCSNKKEGIDFKSIGLSIFLWIKNII